MLKEMYDNPGDNTYHGEVLLNFLDGVMLMKKLPDPKTIMNDCFLTISMDEVFNELTSKSVLSTFDLYKNKHSR